MFKLRLLIPLFIIVLAHNSYAEDKIYIDSVPDGAEVYMQATTQLLGKTPLILEASKVPNKRFSIMMDVDYFLLKIENVSAFKALYEDLKHRRTYQGSYVPKYFEFDSGVTQAFKNTDGKILYIGTEEAMDYPNSNRIVTLFIPDGKTMSALSDLMLPVGSYGSYEFMKKGLIKDYNLTLNEAERVMYFLSRCGKAKIITPNYPETGHYRELIAIRQGPGNPQVLVNEKLRK